MRNDDLRARQTTSCISPIYVGLFICAIGLVVVSELYELSLYLQGTYKSSYWPSLYESFEVSDWLINYEGGFVRRGLIGQILYEFYLWHPYNVLHVIVGLHYLTLAWLLGIMIKIFRQESFSLFLLPFPILLCYGFLCTRRDFLMLILMYYIYSFYKQCLTGNKIYYLVLQLFSILSIIIYEAAFFHIFPLLLLHYLLRENQKGKKWYRCVLFTILFWSPVIMAMTLVCLYKGDRTMADVIWTSWYDMLHTYPYPSDAYIPTMGAGPGFFARSTVDAVNFHLHMTWLRMYKGIIPAAPFIIFIIMAVFQLLPRLNQIPLSSTSASFKVDAIRMSNILLIQFVSLIPLWGLLSCDLPRVIQYWTVSSLIAYHFIKNKSDFPMFITKTSSIIQNGIDSLKWTHSKWFYIILLLITIRFICPWTDRYTHVNIFF